jgi:KUP system potassium uptake protein
LRRAPVRADRPVGAQRGRKEYVSIRNAIRERLPEAPSKADRWRRLGVLIVGSLGVVYGDIGTSPLYALRECFFGRYAVAPSDANVLGVLSLIAWSLILVISIKYLAFVLRADNDGEGGILALMELVRRPTRGLGRKIVVAVGLFGAALLYGDGMITPAISVLSAVEGLNVATDVFRPYVIPITVAILVGLFAVQRLGTAGIAKLFGPTMVLWFGVLAASGVAAIVQEPSVLMAVNPSYGVEFLLHHGLVGVTILGIVFLVVTGGEALYADIGHFGTFPIRVGWYGFALPSLLINYFGQGAIVLARSTEISNPFYEMFPDWSLYPMVVLATCATVIASQAIISGAFSLTFQAIQLGYLPRVGYRHTSGEQRGQIYIPFVNWTLLAATVGLVLGFRHSGNLASAYGAAITTTMVITTLLFHRAMRKVFGWPAWVAVVLTAAFLIIDLSFFTANMRKFFDGGWFPLLIAGVIFFVMATWRRGLALHNRKSRNRALPIRQFLHDIGGGGAYRRVPGQAVYLTANPRGTPHALKINIEHNRALHRQVVIYTAYFVKAPRVSDDKHLKITRLREDMTRIIAYYGFMETPDVPADLASANDQVGLGLDLDRVTYFLGGDIPLVRGELGMGPFRSWLYARLARNQARATGDFGLPAKQVFEIGQYIPV